MRTNAIQTILHVRTYAMPKEVMLWQPIDVITVARQCLETVTYVVNSWACGFLRYVTKLSCGSVQLDRCCGSDTHPARKHDMLIIELQVNYR